MVDTSFFDFEDEFNQSEDAIGEESQSAVEFIGDGPDIERVFDDFDDKAKQTALFRLKVIRYTERRLEGGWTRNNLSPIIDSFTDLHGEGAPSPRTLADWKKAYYESGRNVLSLVPKHYKKGNHNQNEETSDLVAEAINTKFLTKERLSVSSTYQYYKSRVIEENNLAESDVKKRSCVSERTFYNRVNTLPPYEVALARYGKRYADNKFKTVGTMIPATRVMECVEIDHTPIPVIVLDDQIELPLGRPILTILYDHYSTCIVGLSVNFRKPSFETVRSALLNAMLKKDSINEKYSSIVSEWPCHGKITNLIVDNGAEFWSDSFESALKSVVTDIHYNQKGKPWRKPGVEKSFDTFYKKLFSRFPGKTFSNPTELKDYNPKRDAVVKMSLFLELLYKWLIDVYHHSSDTRQTRIPIKKWQQSEETLIFYDGQEAERVKIELGIVNHRTLRRGAIHLHSLRYQSSELEEYGMKYSVKARGSSYLKTKTDPHDISSIYVFLEEEDRYISVPAVDPSGYTKGRSLYEHLRIRSVQRLKTQLDKDEVSLAEASLYIDRRLDEAVKEMEKANSKGKRSLPKTAHASKIAAQRGVGSEGPTSIVSQTNPSKRVDDKNDSPPLLDNLGDIVGY